MSIVADGRPGAHDPALHSSSAGKAASSTIYREPLWKRFIWVLARRFIWFLPLGASSRPKINGYRPNIAIAPQQRIFQASFLQRRSCDAIRILCVFHGERLVLDAMCQVLPTASPIPLR